MVLDGVEKVSPRYGVTAAEAKAPLCLAAINGVVLYPVARKLVRESGGPRLTLWLTERQADILALLWEGDTVSCFNLALAITGLWSEDRLTGHCVRAIIWRFNRRLALAGFKIAGSAPGGYRRGMKLFTIS